MTTPGLFSPYKLDPHYRDGPLLLAIADPASALISLAYEVHELLESERLR
jgi:hypothetical protein